MALQISREKNQWIMDKVFNSELLNCITYCNGFLVKNVVKQRRAQFLSTHAQMQESIDHPRHRKILCWKTIPTPRCVKLFRSSFLLLRKFFSFRKKKEKCIQDKNYATTWRVEKSMQYWNICWFVPQENKWIEIWFALLLESKVWFCFPQSLLQLSVPKCWVPKVMRKAGGTMPSKPP